MKFLVYFRWNSGKIYKTRCTFIVKLFLSIMLISFLWVWLRCLNCVTTRCFWGIDVSILILYFFYVYLYFCVNFLVYNMVPYKWGSTQNCNQMVSILYFGSWEKRRSLFAAVIDIQAGKAVSNLSKLMTKKSKKETYVDYSQLYN